MGQYKAADNKKARQSGLSRKGVPQWHCGTLLLLHPFSAVKIKEISRLLIRGASCYEA